MVKGTIFIALLAAVLGLSSCGREDSNGPELLVPVVAQIRFDTAIVNRGPIVEVEQRPGIVRVESQVLNFGPVAALFDAFYVLPGDRVSYGQLLARLNMEQLERQIGELEARVAEMQSRFGFENELRRIDIRIQTAQGATAAAATGRMELDMAIERQNLQLSHLEADIQEMRTRLAQSELRAPFDGTVTYIPERQPGTWVPPFWSILYIAMEDAPVFVEYTGTTPFTHGENALIEATINNEVYSATRIRLTREQALYYGSPTPVRFSIETEDRLPIGAFVSLEIFLYREEDLLRLPRNTLFFNPDMGFYVYRIINNQLEMTVITTGIHTSTYVEILGGLAEGDEVYVRS